MGFESGTLAAIVCFGTLTLMIACWAHEKWLHKTLAGARLKYMAEFRDRFPPITDDEFMKLCDPGTNRDIALGVRRVISEALGVEYDCVYPSARLVEDLGAE